MGGADLRRSRTSKHPGSMARGVLMAFVFCGVGAYLGYVGGFWHWVAAVILGVVGLLLAVGSIFVREGACPACGTLNSELKEGEFNLCVNRKCRVYLQGNGDELWQVPDDALANAPSFGAVLPDKFGWPPGCCVCGQAATRIIPISLHVKDTGRNLATSAVGLAFGRIVVRTGGGTMVTVNTPHCEAHMDGAILESPAVGPLRIVFRSHQFQKQFRKHNNVEAS